MQEVDHNQDRYPDLLALLEEIEHEEDFPEGPIERLEITGLASGEATWRVWPARADEPIGGYYPSS